MNDFQYTSKVTNISYKFLLVASFISTLYVLYNTNLKFVIMAVKNRFIEHW